MFAKLLSLVTCLMDVAVLIYLLLSHQLLAHGVMFLVAVIFLPIPVLKLHYDMHFGYYKYSLIKERTTETIERVYTAFVVAICLLNILSVIGTLS